MDDDPETITRCWHCGRTIDGSDHYCRGCGEGQGPALAWYYRPVWILILALTVLGPFAIVPIMRTPRLSAGAKWAFAIILIAFFAYFGWELWKATEALLDAV